MTTTIWGAHGAVRDSTSTRFTHRNFIDYEAVSAYLAARQPRFVPLEDALQGYGDALTIDDATVAAKNLAMAAIEHGHAVTLFVTGDVCARAVPHVFHVLNAILDEAVGATCSMNGVRLDLDEHVVKSIVRRNLKSRFAPVPDYDRRLQVVLELSSALGLRHPEVPDHARTLTRDELVEMARAGVRLENHGWEHTDISRWSEAARRDLLDRGRAFIERELGSSPRYFAVPFGEVAPSSSGGPFWGAEAWFLLTDKLPVGPISPGVINRKNLKVP